MGGWQYHLSPCCYTTIRGGWTGKFRKITELTPRFVFVLYCIRTKKFNVEYNPHFLQIWFFLIKCNKMKFCLLEKTVNNILSHTELHPHPYWATPSPLLSYTLTLTELHPHPYWATPAPLLSYTLTVTYWATRPSPLLSYTLTLTELLRHPY